MKKIRQIIIASILLIILLTGLILYQIKYHPSPPALECRISVSICGTQPLKLTENENKGREIFNSNCAACHKLDFKSTGPALRGTDSLVFIDWIIEKKHKIDTTKIEELGKDYHRTMFKDYVKEKDLALIIQYCNHKKD